MSSLRIGIVGCGSIAQAHVRAYAGLSGARIVEVFDIDPAAAQRLAGPLAARVAGSVEEMAERGRLDAVSICSPPGVHEAHCLPFINSGAAVLCEKPLAAELESARRIRDAVVERRAVFMLGFCHRFHGPVIELKRLIDSGALGEGLFFRNLFGGYLPLAANHRAVRSLSGGGALVDNGCHSIDLFRYLMGEPTHLSAAAANVMQELAVEDFGLLQLRIGRRCFGQITSTYSLPAAVNSVEWHGSKGVAVLTYFENDPELKYRVRDDLNWKTVDCGKMPGRFEAQIEHFVRCVRAGQTPDVTVEDGLRAAELIDAAYRAAETGREEDVEAANAMLSKV